MGACVARKTPPTEENASMPEWKEIAVWRISTCEKCEGGWRRQMEKCIISLHAVVTRSWAGADKGKGGARPTLLLSTILLTNTILRRAVTLRQPALVIMLPQAHVPVHE